MKKVFLTVLFLFCFSALLFSQTGYTINGHINGLPDNYKIYLINGSQRKKIDSTVVKSERFILKGNLLEAAHTYLYAGNTNKLADILLDNRKVFVTGNQPTYDSIKVIGSEIDMEWKEWYKEDQKIGYLKYRLNEIFEAVHKNQDTINSNKLKEIVKELANDRIVLLKECVKKYGNSPAGAVLPTLCTLQDQLTKNDFLEMYNSLSLPMQKTYYGKEILALSNNK